jgi:hypothetical protein
MLSHQRDRMRNTMDAYDARSAALEWGSLALVALQALAFHYP